MNMAGSSPLLYSYQPLENPVTISIIVLPPPLQATAVHADRSILRYDLSGPPNYDAVNYCWGANPESTSLLLCDDLTSHLKITLNVEEMLGCFRKSTTPRYQ
ncbi:hypothetical protein B0J11DRAFT_528393 [Dendryphion nanum]|uniref:Heterokaryon incompatibility domain-containing protein n=1 Tax=Dendryphion nanum TaxID=256645 RepID=A0A9P9INB6_9PLEO|nr:hypothetical protein B0J11DRAFT_528393 [Dendryphion nanum]